MGVGVAGGVFVSKCLIPMGGPVRQVPGIGRKELELQELDIHHVFHLVSWVQHLPDNFSNNFFKTTFSHSTIIVYMSHRPRLERHDSALGNQPSFAGIRLTSKDPMKARCIPELSQKNPSIHPSTVSGPWLPRCLVALCFVCFSIRGL